MTTILGPEARMVATAVASIHRVVGVGLGSKLLKIFLPDLVLADCQGDGQGAQDETVQGRDDCQDVDPADLAASQGVETHLVSAHSGHVVLGPGHREHADGDQHHQAGEDLQGAAYFVHARGTANTTELMHCKLVTRTNYKVITH